MEQQNGASLIYWLNMLNENWKRFDDLERGKTNLLRGELRVALREAEISYAYAELQLAKAGWRWDQLAYDHETKTYSFPEQKLE
jgi:hypothetical protein